MIFEKQWEQLNEENLKCDIYLASNGTTGIETRKGNIYIILLPRNRTIANVAPEISDRTITQYWQTEKLPDIQRKISDQFYSIRQRQDNWDNRGSLKPNRVSLSNAQGIIEDLLSSVIAEGYIWLTPFISSDEDGNITIEWHKGQYELHIEVREDEAEYIKVWGTNIENEMHLDFLDKCHYLALWDWLLHG